MIEVRMITALECYPIRQKVLWQHKNIADCSIEIDNQNGAFHLGVFENNELLCIGSFFKQNKAQFSETNQYRLRAMATLASAQKKGLAKKLLAHAFEELKARKQELLWCDARIIATEFYTKMGFNKLGNSYEIPIIGTHYLMYKNIAI
jgi:predicted GNAT family N-acyltransferase